MTSNESPRARLGGAVCVCPDNSWGAYATYQGSRLSIPPMGSTALRRSSTLLALLVLLCAAVRPAFAQDPIQWSLALVEKGPIVGGDTFTVALSARIDPTWHLYGPTQLPGGPTPLVIAVPLNQPFSQLGENEFALPRVVYDPNFSLDTQFYEEHAAFS